MRGMIIEPMISTITALNGVARLTHLGVIRLEGDDAAKFIHGQLTQDFSLLGLNEARLAALCSPKGRMLSSFIGFKRSTSDILLICSLDLLPAMVKRLSMFVMRAKAKVSDASSNFAVYGLIGTAVRGPAASAPWALEQTDAGALIQLYPADGQLRQLWIAAAETPAPEGPALSAELWAWSEVRSGIATVTAPVSEAFVPQMLNYESVGGVSFKKGCYPGQEVVARSQFRGTLKRRAFVAHAPGALAAGDEVVAAADPSQPVGTVVQAAAAPGGGFDAIVSLQLSAVADGGLHARDLAGPALELLPLPYVLLQDV
jgi:tRNA-modifying protein YgfZ